jgi:hypothetical protein
VLTAASTCPALPPAADARALTGIPPARYLVTAIATLEALDAQAHLVRCAILGDRDAVLAISPPILVGADPEAPADPLVWSAIDTVAGGTVRVRCQVQTCGGTSPAAVSLVDTRIAANRSE